MKKINLILAGISLFMACNKEEKTTKNSIQSENSGIILNIENESDFEQIVVGKQTNTNYSIDTVTFDVIITDRQTNEIIYDDTFQNLGDSLGLDPGSYNIEVSNNVPTGFSNAIKYHDSKNFSINPNTYTNETINLEIKSFQLTLNYSDNFKNRFTDYEALLYELDYSHSNGWIIVDSNEIDASKPYYFNERAIEFIVSIKAEDIVFEKSEYLNAGVNAIYNICLLYTSPSPRDA